MAFLRRPVLAAAAATLVLVACATATDHVETSPGPSSPALAPTTSIPDTVAETTETGSAASATTTTASTTSTTSTTSPTTTATTAPAGRAAVLTDYPRQPVGVPFPTERWPVADLPDAVSQLTFDRATERAFGAADAQTRVQSVVVVLGGEIVYERYHPLDGVDKRYHSFSVAKSMTSALVGLAVGDGELTVDQTNLRREWRQPGDPRRNIALRDLLQMSSGLEWDEDYTAPSDVIDMINARSSAAFVASKPLESDPGTVFEYSTGTTALLAGIVADRLGGCGAATRYLNERLFDSIGITSDGLIVDDRGCWVGGLGANMTTRDFARFGLLYLRGGAWDGERLLSKSWIDASRTAASTNGSYGYQWWLYGKDVFMARGLLGQLIVVAPSLDVVIAINSSGGDSDSLATAILDELRNPSGPDPAPTTTTTTTTTTTIAPTTTRATLPPTD